MTPSRKPTELVMAARYLTPTGRVCRLVELHPAAAGQADEVTLAYEVTNGSGPVALGEHISMTMALAQRTLVRVG